MMARNKALGNKAEADYAEGLKQVFAETYRLLKPERWMSDGLLQTLRKELGQ